MKKKRNWKDIRNAFVMFCVMVAMLSTASFAWFTLTSSPTVTNLQMTAAADGGLKISKDGTTYVNAIDLKDKSNGADANPWKLTPVSVKDATANFYLPVYGATEVTGLETSPLADNQLDGYVAKYEYWLKSEKGDVDVGIIAANVTTLTGSIGIAADGSKANLAGSFVRPSTVNTTSSAAENAANAVRIGFHDGTKMYIYEPNQEQHTTGTVTRFLSPSVSIPTVDVASKTDGSFSTGAGTATNTSKALFKVGEAGKKITMYIWLEGTDEDCVDQIKTDEIEAQIQFTAIKGATGGTNP